MRGVLAALAFVLLAAPAAADQKDPRLDALFTALKAAPDAASANKIDAQIWRIWLQHPDKRTQEATLVGVTFMNKGQAELAEMAFKEAIGRHPDFAEAWNKRATLRYFKGDLRGSVADYAHVLKLEPRHFGALAGLGMIHAALEDWDTAIHWYTEALAVHSQNVGVQVGLAEAKQKAKGEET
jgi:tetratricopeptide (TPR) repeat protein